jgi:hypothetical protein
MTALNPPISSSDLVGTTRVNSAHHHHHSCSSYDTMNFHEGDINVVPKSGSWHSGLGLLNFSEFILPVDQFAIWRHQLMVSSSHSSHDGSDSIRCNHLKEVVTQQYACNMVSDVYKETTVKNGRQTKIPNAFC